MPVDPQVEGVDFFALFRLALSGEINFPKPSDYTFCRGYQMREKIFSNSLVKTAVSPPVGSVRRQWPQKGWKQICTKSCHRH